MSKIYVLKHVLFAFVACMLVTSSSYATDALPQASIEGFLNSIRSMEFPVADQAEQKKLTDQAASYLDLEAMGKKALAEHWDAMTSDERKAFMDLFWKLIENIAYPRTKSFLGDQKILYQPEKKIERGVEVASKVADKESALDVPVTYNLYEQDGQWKIYDIFMDGISMTEDLNSQFDKMISGGSVSSLLTRMAERLDKAQKKNIG